MPEGQVLEFSGVTKRFGAVTAVSDFTARVEPGLVTGFLGPNGAGKTTSLRILLGLVRPTAGDATIGGVHYASLANPLRTVGAVLESSSFHPGRTAAAHLNVYAQAARIPRARVDEVLELVGLTDAATRKVGGFSTGMRQRLGLAYALLGDPGVLVLDEPTNGLDPEGIKWIRSFLRQLAREGRTVLVSSHLLTEVQQTVDALLIIAQGRLVFQGGLDELADPAEQATVVDSPDRAALAEALRAADVPFEVLRSGLTVRGIDSIAVGLAAAKAGVPLSTLHKRGPALEEVFLDLVNGTRLHASASGLPADDVIPAIESGPIEVVPVEQPAPDATPAVVEEAGDAGPTTAETPADEAGDAAATAGAPEPAAQAVGATAGAEAAEVAAGADDTGTASFAVASTGVVDIIVVGATEAVANADAEEERSAPADGDAGMPEDGAAARPEDGDADAEALADIDAELSSEPVVSDADDRPWEEYVKTDADLEADRFFAAFDAEAAAAEAAAAEAAEAAEAAGTEEAQAEGEAPGAEAGETESPAEAEAEQIEAEAPAEAAEAAGAAEAAEAPAAEAEAEAAEAAETAEPAAAETEADASEPAEPAEAAEAESHGSETHESEEAAETEAELELEPDTPEPEPEPETDTHEPEAETDTHEPEPESPESHSSEDPDGTDIGGDEASAPPDDLEDDRPGTLADLSPDWTEHDVHGHGDHEGGEQR